MDNVVASTIQWGQLPPADRRAGALVVLPAFVVQAIVGIFAISARDAISGTLMLSFATTSLVDCLILLVYPRGAAAVSGIFYIVLAALMLASALAKRAPAAVLLVASPRFLIAGIAESRAIRGFRRLPRCWASSASARVRAC